MNPTIALMEDDVSVAACFDVLRELRPHLQSTDDLVARVRAQRPEGFLLAALSVDGVVEAVAGFRLQTMLFCGRFLYVDDLITRTSTRSHGHGRCLLAWLYAYAREHGCERLQLDSGTHRTDAHRFYHREGLTISAFHFGSALR